MRLDLDASSDGEGSPPPPPSVRTIAYDVFSRTYSYELLAGTHEWLEELIEHFEITDESNIRDTFEHLALGCKAGSSISTRRGISGELTGFDRGRDGYIGGAAGEDV